MELLPPAPGPPQSLIRSKKLETFDWDEVYVLNPRIRLYPDDGRIIGVEVEEGDKVEYSFQHWLAEPQKAVVAALLDGRRTLRELGRVVQYLLGAGAGDAEKTIAGFVKIMPLIRAKDAPAGTRLRKYNPADFIAAAKRRLPVPRRRMRIPLSILWIPTMDCPVRCGYCYMNRRYLPANARLSHERNLRLVEEIIALDVPWLSIAGGDLFMHEHIFEYLEMFYRADVMPPFYVSTKVPLTGGQIKRLAAMGMRGIQYSVDGPNAKICDFLVGTPGWFDRSVQTIRGLVEAGIRVKVHAILTGYNHQYAEETIIFLHSLGVKEIKLDNYSRSTFHHSESMWVPRTAAEELEKKLDGLRARCPGTEIHYRIFSDPLDQPEEEKKRAWPDRSACTAYVSNVTILPDGECFGCEQLLQDDYLSMGNVREQTIRELWDSPRVRELIYPPREYFRGTPCFDCGEFEQCVYERGYCFRFSYAAFRSVYTHPPACPKAPKGLRVTGCV